MKKFGYLALLLAMLTSAACSAQESTTCQPACGEDKRECHALAQHAAKMEDGPLASMNAAIPKLSFTGANGPLIENKGNQVRDFRDRRQGLSRACDEKYMACVHACTKAVSEPDADSVVLRPRAERKPAPMKVGE